MLVDRRVRQLVNFATVSLVGYLLASAAAVLMPTPRLLASGVDCLSAEKNAVKTVLQPLSSFDPILGRNVFNASVDSGPEPGAAEDPTNLGKIKAVLLGTMVSDTPSLSRAVVLKGKVQWMVKLDDTLEGTRVVEIRRRVLVLEVGGQRRRLVLDPPSSMGGRRDKPAGRIPFSRAAVKLALRDIPALSENIRFAEVAHGGHRRLWIRQIRPESLFGKAGLKKGDIILRVGGQGVDKDTRPEDFFNLIENRQVDVDLVRDGSPLTLSLVLTK